MFGVELYATVRQLVFLDGMSRRDVARRLGISRDTVAKMCRYAAPPGYVRTKAVERPKIGPLIGVIDAILDADETAPAKRGTRRSGFGFGFATSTALRAATRR